MRILVLGGTRFLTRELVRQALDAGHDVTCAARGDSGTPPAGARFVAIDRTSPDALTPLGAAEFDAVVDPATRPSWVRSAAGALRDRTGHWTAISSCSVYPDEQTPGQTTDAPIREPAPVDSDEGDMEIYGELKVASEKAALAVFGDRTLVCRPGLIVGPGDRSGRFTYWAERLADGGDVLAPGAPQDAVQLVDVRDLAAWLLRLVEEGRTGVYDAMSQPMTRAELLSAVAEGVGTQPSLVWVVQEFLLEHEVQPWMGPRSLPLWLPLPDYAGFMSRDLSRSYDAGLSPRPLAETARDTLAWVREDPDPARTGLTRDEEAELLAAWRANQSA